MMLLLVFRSFEIASAENAAIWFPKQTHTTHIHRRPACGQHEASQNLKRPEIGDAWFRLKCFILVSVVVLQKFVCLLWLCHYTFRSNDIFTVVKAFALTPHHISSFHRTALLCSGCCVFTYSVDLFIEVCIWEVRNCIFQTTTTKTEKHREREEKFEHVKQICSNIWFDDQTMILQNNGFGFNSTTNQNELDCYCLVNSVYSIF